MPSSVKLPRVTTGDGNYADRLANVLAAAFAGDALNRAVIRHSDSLPNDAEISHERWVEHFISSTKSKIACGGIAIEAGNWAAAALWFVIHLALQSLNFQWPSLYCENFADWMGRFPPGVERPPPRTSPDSPLNEYFQKFARAKKRHLGDRQYWYLNLIGRHPDRTEPGK
jgi:hypothetical protein